MSIDYSKRIYGLDVYRAIAILLVVKSHAGIFAGDLFKELPYVPLIDGVELFFALSGFLIGGILIRSVENKGSFGIKDLLHFWKRRWFRTLPNYFLILFLNVLVVYFGFIKGDIHQFSWKFFLFLQNFHEGFYDFFWESWSLSIEEWFYIVLPILIGVLFKFTQFRRALLITTVLLLILPLLYRLSLPAPVDHFDFDINIRKVVLTRMDAIMYGVLGAYWAHYHAGSWFRLRWPMFFLGLLTVYMPRILGLSWESPYGPTFMLSLVSLGCMLMLPLAASVRDFKAPAIGKTLTHISLISYSMYLINLGLVAQIIELNFPPSNRPEMALMYIIYWAVVIGMSTLIYTYFERPMMRLRDRF